MVTQGQVSARSRCTLIAQALNIAQLFAHNKSKATVQIQIFALSAHTQNGSNARQHVPKPRNQLEAVWNVALAPASVWNEALPLNPAFEQPGSG